MLINTLEILKKGSFFFKNSSTNTSFAEFNIIGVDLNSVILSFIFRIGNIFLSGFLKLKFSIFVLFFKN